MTQDYGSVSKGTGSNVKSPPAVPGRLATHGEPKSPARLDDEAGAV